MPDQSCLVAVPQCEGRNILGHDTASTYHSILSDCYTGQYSGVCPDGRTAFYHRSLKFLRIFLRSGTNIIRKCNIRTDKYIILEANSVPKLYSGFYRYIVSYDDIILDQYICTDITVLPDTCFRKNHTEHCPRYRRLLRQKVDG